MFGLSRLLILLLSGWLLACPARAQTAAPCLAAPAAVAGDAGWDSRFAYPADSTVVDMAVSDGGDLWLSGWFPDSTHETNGASVVRWTGTRGQRLGPGCGEVVAQLTLTPAGRLYAVRSGNFGVFGGAVVVQWAGACWQRVGVDSIGGTVTAMVVGRPGELYVDGSFHAVGRTNMVDTTAYEAMDWRLWRQGNIARWDGQHWQRLGTGLNGRVSALAVAPNGDLYVGGEFTNAGGDAAADYLARWDGHRWHAVVAGLNRPVRCLALAPDGSLYIGGQFTRAGGRAVRYVARYDGQRVQTLGRGPGAGTGLLALTRQGQLWAVARGEVMCWTGAGWQAMGVSGAPVSDLVALPDGTVYVSGTLTIQGASPRACTLASWEGGRWQALRTGAAYDEGYGLYQALYDQPIRALATAPDGSVVVGGRLIGIGRQSASLVARWQADQWQAVGPMRRRSAWFWETVQVATAPNGHLLLARTRLVRRRWRAGVWHWNGHRWRRLGREWNGKMYALAVAPTGEVYAGGEFAGERGDAAIRNLARWDGRRWQPLANPGGGLAIRVLALAFAPNGSLLAGGGYLNADDEPSPYVACLTDSGWHRLSGLGLRGSVVTALAVTPGGAVWAGGGLQHTGFLSRWEADTLQWFTLNGPVEALQVTPDGELYAGGAFTDACENPAADYVIRWDGHTCQPLGSGLNGPVRALTIGPNGDVYVGGGFTATGSGRKALSRFGIYHPPRRAGR